VAEALNRPTGAVTAETADTATTVRPPRRLDIVGRRNWFFGLSLLIILPGIFFMVTRGFLLGIDFAGGTEFTVNFAGHPSLAQVQSAVSAENQNGTVIATSGGGYISRYGPLTPAGQTFIQNDLTHRPGSKPVPTSDRIVRIRNRRVAATSGVPGTWAIAVRHASEPGRGPHPNRPRSGVLASSGFRKPRLPSGSTATATR